MQSSKIITSIPLATSAYSRLLLRIESFANPAQVGHGIGSKASVFLRGVQVEVLAKIWIQRQHCVFIVSKTMIRLQNSSSLLPRYTALSFGLLASDNCIHDMRESEDLFSRLTMANSAFLPFTGARVLQTGDTGG